MDQSRKEFLRRFVIGAASVPVILAACSKTDVSGSGGSSSDSTSSSGSSADSCTVSPTETEGPYPSHTPSSLLRSNIVDDRTGVALTIKLTVENANSGCAALEGVLVDIWHCDKDGNYSEYGGTGTQSTDYTSVHFLRGRQATDSNGAVAFTSIFPGWYTGRATHIHVHVFDSSGNSLLITQIAFPEGDDSAVALVNAATSYGYSKGMTGYTYNASDNVFSDDTTGAEICTLTGSVSAGYVLTYSVKVKA